MFSLSLMCSTFIMMNLNVNLFLIYPEFSKFSLSETIFSLILENSQALYYLKEKDIERIYYSLNLLVLELLLTMYRRRIRLPVLLSIRIFVPSGTYG